MACSWKGTITSAVSTKKIVSPVTFVTFPKLWGVPVPGRVSKYRALGKTGFPNESTAWVRIAPTCPDAVKRAVSSAALTCPSVRAGMYCQCTDLRGAGNTCTNRCAFTPNADAVALSSLATVDGVQNAPARPPESVGCPVRMEPEVPFGVQVTGTAGTPRPRKSSTRTRIESGSGTPACTLQQKTSESAAGDIAATPATGKCGPVASGRYLTPYWAVSRRVRPSESALPNRIRPGPDTSPHQLFVAATESIVPSMLTNAGAPEIR